MKGLLVKLKKVKKHDQENNVFYMNNVTFR